jgi:hypothetical protein
VTASGRIQRRIRHAAVIKDIIIFYKNFISFPLEYHLIGKNVTSLSDEKSYCHQRYILSYSRETYFSRTFLVLGILDIELGDEGANGELTAPLKADDADLYFHSQVQRLFFYHCKHKEFCS